MDMEKTNEIHLSVRLADMAAGTAQRRGDLKRIFVSYIFNNYEMIKNKDFMGISVIVALMITVCITAPAAIFLLPMRSGQTGNLRGDNIVI